MLLLAAVVNVIAVVFVCCSLHNATHSVSPTDQEYPSDGCYLHLLAVVIAFAVVVVVLALNPKRRESNCWDPPCCIVVLY